VNVESSRALAWYEKPLWIALLAFVVLGPFALPLVWRSPAIGAGARPIWAAAILLYTAFLCWQTFQVASMMAAQLQIR
jgi:hypothetical protein